MRDDDGASLIVDGEFLRYMSSASGDVSRPTHHYLILIIKIREIC